MNKYNFIPRTGDQALFSPRGIIGNIIAAIRGPKSHAGTIVVTANRALVYELTAEGARLWPLSAYVRNGERITIRRIPEAACPPPGWAERLEEFAWATWGVWRYSLPKLHRHIIYALIGGPRSDNSWLDRYTDEELRQMALRQICSESASFVLRRFADYDPVPGLADAATAPRHLYLTEWLDTIVERVEIIEEASA